MSLVNAAVGASCCRPAWGWRGAAQPWAAQL